jgi:hypothetical protein
MSLPSARELHGDQRGAIMLMGLCMSCFLIGGLWFLIGIGDAIVFRDQMQEASDHAAFTSAVLHAKGMNFISACNLVLLAMIAIHIIMGLITDIMTALCFATGIMCVPLAPWRSVYTGYGKGFKQVANVIHVLEQAAATGYPFIGAAKAYTLGMDYGNFGPKPHSVNILAVSTSMVPGSVMNNAVNNLFNQKAPEKLPSGVEGPTRPGTPAYAPGTKSFLPVEPKPFNEVCKRISNKSVDFLIDLTGMTWLVAPVKTLVKEFIRNSIVLRYCNDLGSTAGGTMLDAIGGQLNKANDKIDELNKGNQDRNAKLPAGETPKPDAKNLKVDGLGGLLDPGLDPWWGSDGPFVPWGGTSNGSPWQQVWALNIMPAFSDDQQQRVHIGANNKLVASDAKTSAYFAQAEFFFDCAQDWWAASCNGNLNAAFSIKWRAKLRRLQAPQMGTLVTSFAGQFARNTTAYGKMKDMFSNSAASRKLNDSFGGVIGATGIQSAIGTAITQGEAAIGSVGGQGAGAIDGAQNAATGNLGAYH